MGLPLNPSFYIIGFSILNHPAIGVSHFWNPPFSIFSQGIPPEGLCRGSFLAEIFSGRCTDAWA